MPVVGRHPRRIAGTDWTLYARPTSASTRSPTSRSHRTTSTCRAATAATLRVHYLDEGPTGGAGRAADARRAVVVLPVPQDDPGPDRGRASLHRARPRRLRPLRQADRTRRLHLRPPRRVDARRAVRRARPARRHPRRPGLGRPDRAAARRRASRPVRTRRRPPTRSCRPATTPPGEAFLNWQRFSQTVEDFDVGFIVGSGCHIELTAGGRRGLRRAVPRRLLQGRRAPVPDARADLARRSGDGREPEGVGDAAGVGRSRSSPRSPTRTRSRAAATARSSARCPAARANRTRRIEGGGHFLQEDCGEQLARIVVNWIAGN